MDPKPITGSDLVSLFRPSACDLRLYLREIGTEEAEPSPYSQLLVELGKQHEQMHLASFVDAEVVDISQLPATDRFEATRDAVGRGAAVIYQGALRGEHSVDGARVALSGYPDFLINSEAGYVIRDSKISRRISAREHPEIYAQLGLYAMMYLQTFGAACAGLEVHSGADLVVPIEDLDDAVAIAETSIERAHRSKTLSSLPFEPVGWSKCQSCRFTGFCWAPAVEERKVSIVPDLNTSAALQLHAQGIETIDDLLSTTDVSKLTELRGVGAKSAEKILRNARAIAANRLEVFAEIELPEAKSLVMFDLEGVPPHLDNNEKIYIWGLKVYGEDAGEFIPAVAGFDTGGDRDGWLSFLAAVENIVSELGEIPFVHWAAYEKTMIKRYVERFGDVNGTAEMLQEKLLLDLLPVTKASVALPIPSYSLKVVEKYVGFERTLPESNGDWAIVQFIEATELGDAAQRDAIVAKVLQYNE